jgi:hypothetical protein
MHTIQHCTCLWILLSLFQTSSSSSPLQWEFRTFSKAVPKEAVLSSLYYKLGLKAQARSEIVGFEPADDSTLTTGATWEWENQGAVDDPTWTRKMDLLYNIPTSRHHSRSAMISWSLDNSLGEGQGVVLFGGQSTGSKLQGDTWLYQKNSFGAYWFEETDNASPLSGAVVPKRYNHAMANVGFNSSLIVMFGGMGDNTMLLNDTWVLSAVAYFAVSLSWEMVPGSTNNPPPRW